MQQQYSLLGDGAELGVVGVAVGGYHGYVEQWTESLWKFDVSHTIAGLSIEASGRSRAPRGLA